MATARKGESVNLAMLHEGRTLFAHRCIECHTLPVFWRYSSKDWPNIDFVGRRLNRPWSILREPAVALRHNLAGGWVDFGVRTGRNNPFFRASFFMQFSGAWRPLTKV